MRACVGVARAAECGGGDALPTDAEAPLEGEGGEGRRIDQPTVSAKFCDGTHDARTLMRSGLMRSGLEPKW